MKCNIHARRLCMMILTTFISISIAGIAPYTVWGDDGRGDYYEKTLGPGTYTVTARATNNNGVKSSTFTKTFTVAPSFGIEDLVLVDARRDKDIPGALDCDPVNECLEGSEKFNIRAKTFGNVDSVYLTSEGPIREAGRTEGEYEIGVA